MSGALYTTSEGQFQLMPAEVQEIIYSDSNPNLTYGIRVKLLDGTAGSDTTSVTSITAKPLNVNILRVPIVGEIVLLLKAPSSYTSGLRSTTDNYYLDIVSLQSSVHHNSLPTITKLETQNGQANGDSNKYSEAGAGNTQKQSQPKVDENFTENSSVKPLQHYVGDVLFLGRYGNSMRFSTTPKSGKFSIKPKWSKGPESAPITILRNSAQDTNTNRINDFTTENFTKDDNVIVMASGQNIEFEQSSKVLKSASSKGITSWKDENWGTTPQILISSGRIVFNSSQKEIIAFAKNGIALSSETTISIDSKDNVSLNATKIELGTDANEQLILGNVWQKWMEDFIQQLSLITVITPSGPAAPLTSAPQWPQIENLKAKLNTLLSNISYTKK